MGSEELGSRRVRNRHLGSVYEGHKHKILKRGGTAGHLAGFTQPGTERGTMRRRLMVRVVQLVGDRHGIRERTQP